MPFDYKGAIDAGYTEDEIKDYFTKSNPNFDMKGAIDSGYSIQEIGDFLGKPKIEERSMLEKGARVAGQYALGVLEGTPVGLAYDIGTSIGGSKPMHSFNERMRIGEDIEYLYEKNAGKSIEQWPKADQDLYASLEKQIRPGGELENVAGGPDISIRNIAQKATGVDLNPEGITEKSAQWAGWIKDPKKLFELSKTGFGVKDVVKAIAPSGKEALRGIGAGVALQIAEEGGFGPIGTLASALIGDISGNLASMTAKGAAKIITRPREAIAEAAAKFTKKDKLGLRQQIIKDFRDSGVQADIGTITNSDLVKFIQSRLAQSGLTGDALDELKKTITTQVKDEYKQIADSLGQSRFATVHDAGEVSKSFIKQIRETDLNEVRDLYKTAEKSLKQDAHVDTRRLLSKVEEIEANLKPGQVKSSEQSAVLEILQRLKRDITDSEGKRIGAKVKDLMNNKIALNDIVNYEIQGGQKQLLKGVISELDRAIVSHGRDNPGFASKYVSANKRFGEHSKKFRNQRVSQFLKDTDPSQVLNKLNTVQGIRDLEVMLQGSKGGKELMNDLKRLKLDKMISENFEDSVSNQIKFGTFSKLLEKGKNREIINELLPKSSLKRLKKLQKNSGLLAESAQKFLNSSRSGITVEDAGIVSKALWDFGNLLSGNPWPLLKTAGGISGARYLTKLMGDPTFLKLVEDLVLATQKNNSVAMDAIAQQLVPLIRTAMSEEKD